MDTNNWNKIGLIVDFGTKTNVNVPQRLQKCELKTRKKSLVEDKLPTVSTNLDQQKLNKSDFFSDDLLFSF